MIALIILLSIWYLCVGVLVVAATAYFELDPFADSDGDRVCTVLFWPLALIAMVLIGLGRLGKFLGE